MTIFDYFIQPLESKPRKLLLKEEIYLIIEKKIWWNCLCYKTRYNVTGLEPEDLAQEVRMRVYKNIDKLVDNIDKKKNPEGYISTLVKWRIADVFKKYSKSEDVYYSSKCEVLPPQNDRDEVEEIDGIRRSIQYHEYSEFEADNR